MKRKVFPAGASRGKPGPWDRCERLELEAEGDKDTLLLAALYVLLVEGNAEPLLERLHGQYRTEWIAYLQELEAKDSQEGS
jgi:hypothetical protein